MGRSRTVYLKDCVSVFRSLQFVDHTHMLKLCDIRARNIDQRSIGLNNAIRDKRSHAEVVVLHSNALKVTPGEDQSSEVLIDRLQQRLGRGMMKTSSAGMLIAPVAVNSYVIPEISFASAAEGFDGEHIAFFHALGGSGLDEGDLFFAMDLVAQDVMASDVPNRFDGHDFSVELDFVAFHYFLDCLTDVIHPGIDASFLSVYLALQTPCREYSITLSPVLVAALTAASRLS